MPIAFLTEPKIFHIFNEMISYVVQISPTGHLLHGYWGKRCGDQAIKNVLANTFPKNMAFNLVSAAPDFSLENAPQEISTYGHGDFRSPSLHVVDGHGHRICNLLYRDHRILEGKVMPEGLPATYAEKPQEASSLVITLVDEVIGLEVDLVYNIFEDHRAITRHTVLRNQSPSPILIERAMSASIPFPRADLAMVSLKGAWARERDIQVAPLHQGLQSIESRRGASSHGLNPFFALSEEGASEDYGQVYAFSLVYSGNFLGQVEVTMNNTCVAMLGMGSFDFAWKLQSGSSFTTPEVVLVHSEQGLGSMSRTFHKLYRERLCRGPWRDLRRPVLLNNWEATYFDFNYDRIMGLAREAKNSGVEMLVLDDGWFGQRNNDKSSLGDWVTNERKLEGGLKRLGEDLNALGLKFGLWFEPEMVSPDSDLYRAHPDWCIHVPQRQRTEGRQQLVLDYSRKDVCENIMAQLSAILSSAPIEYVKWDFNRNLSEMGSALLDSSQQREFPHRYILGLYKVLEHITQKFPHILFESCSGGGGRFDPGMLYYMPQTWTSDNTDAICRLKIQYGTSLVYPLASMGSHLSACPNHQVHRHTPWNTRAQVALFGTFGYELDLMKENAENKASIKQQIELFKNCSSTLHQGELYRLQSPFELTRAPFGNEVSWMVVDQDKSRAVLLWVRILEQPNHGHQMLRLKGLDAKRTYKLCGIDKAFGGDELMYSGLRLPEFNKGDFQSSLWVFEAI